MRQLKPWPTREEWEADAEAHVRQGYIDWESRVPDTSIPEERAEAERLFDALARQARKGLTREINALRERFPDRPETEGARSTWYLAVIVDSDRREDYGRLSTLEDIRRDLGRLLRGTGSGAVHHDITDAAKCGIDLDPEQYRRYSELRAARRARHDAARDATLTDAIRHEVARRQTAEAWQAEVRRRRQVEDFFNGPKVAHR